MNTRNWLMAFAATLTILVSMPQLGRSADTPPAQLSGEAYCTDACCGDNCGISKCCVASCCSPNWQIYGDFLYLRPRNAGLEYAVPMNGPISPGQVPIQEGRTASLNPEFEPGFRVGIGTKFNECSTISASYTRYENSTSDSLAIENPPYVIRSMVMHPSSLDAAADWLNASAQEYMRFEFADADYRRVFYDNGCATINYLVGIRYASLQQQFRSQFESIVREDVNADVNFDGAGFRLGLEAERSGWHNLFLYGKAVANFLGGEFRGNYFQGSSNDPVIAQTVWKEARLVSILECEVGLGWMSCNGHVRASAGYMVNGWLNVVKVPEYISAVQANKYHGPDKIDGNGLVFDGLVSRIELRW
jgi:hypothetical protein